MSYVLNCYRNSATETVKQELLFVGQESGKLIAIRDIIRKVRSMSFILWIVVDVGCTQTVADPGFIERGEGGGHNWCARSTYKNFDHAHKGD